MAFGYKLLTIAVMTVALFAAFSDAGFRGKKRGGFGRRLGRFGTKVEIPTFYRWNQTLSSGHYVNQTVIVPTDNTDRINVRARGNEEAGFVDASSTFVFGNGTSDLAARVRNIKSCFLLDTSLNFNTVNETAARLNGSTNGAYPAVDLDGTGEPLSDDERDELFEEFPALKRMCKRFPIVETVSSSGEATNNTVVVKFLSFNQEINLTVPESD